MIHKTIVSFSWHIAHLVGVGKLGEKENIVSVLADLIGIFVGLEDVFHFSGITLGKASRDGI